MSFRLQMSAYYSVNQVHYFLDETAIVRFVTIIATENLNENAKRSFVWDCMAMKRTSGNYLS